MLDIYHTDYDIVEMIRHRKKRKDFEPKKKENAPADCVKKNSSDSEKIHSIGSYKRIENQRKILVRIRNLEEKKKHSGISYPLIIQTTIVRNILSTVATRLYFHSFRKSM